MGNTLLKVVELAKQAGNAIMPIYERTSSLKILAKADDSPVTEADLLAHKLIIEKLKMLTPNLPILSEESAPIEAHERMQWLRYWLVDPLDGTKEFIQRTGDFTINIALIEQHQPVLGVVYSPVTQTCYFGENSQGAYKENLHGQQITLKTREYFAQNLIEQSDLIILASRRHGRERLDQFLNALKMTYQRRSIGSSLKFCLLAEGQADLYLRFGPTSEWDTAAAHCILREAGGEVWDLSGAPLRYNTKESLLNPEFVAVAEKAPEWAQLVHDFCENDIV